MRSSSDSPTEFPKIVFGLERGFRIGNYRVDERIGSGCTAEAYLVTEISTGARRVLKIYGRFDDTQVIRNLRDFAHYCSFVEKVSQVRLLPGYHHMGHLFLDDAIGHYYMVQEYIAGIPFKPDACSDSMVAGLAVKVAAIHALGFGLGDWEYENLLIAADGIRMVDCDYGSSSKPNRNKAADIKELRRIFGAERWDRLARAHGLRVAGAIRGPAPGADMDHLEACRICSQ